MAFTEELEMKMVADHKEDGTATMSCRWTRNGHETGVWVRYDQDTSHKAAFSKLVQGMWEAIIDPDSFNIEQDTRIGNITEPYWDGLK